MLFYDTGLGLSSLQAFDISSAMTGFGLRRNRVSVASFFRCRVFLLESFKLLYIFGGRHYVSHSFQFFIIAHGRLSRLWI